MQTENERIAGAGCPPREDIVALIRGELGEADAAVVKAHLEKCSSCKAEAESFTRVVAAIQANVPTAVTCDVTDRVMRAVGQQDAELNTIREAGRPSILVPFPIFLRVAALFIIVVLVGLTIRQWTENSKKEMPAAVAAKTGESPDQRNTAVQQALDWLASSQKPSGAWDPVKWGGKKEYEVSLTSMSLLAFLRNDGKSTGKKHDEILSRAIANLLNQQTSSGRIGPECEGMLYNHGIATVALLEYYGKNKDEKVRSALDSALRFTAGQQMNSGGWGYRNDDPRGPNTSISVWQIQGLMLAEKAGWKKSAANLRRGLGWLKGMADESGGFGYQKPSDSLKDNKTLTAMGAYCLMTASLDIPELGALSPQIRSMLERTARQRDDTEDFYRLYFVASALKAGNNDNYRKILSSLQDSLAVRRIKAGSHAGTWAPVDRWGSVGGRLYSTVMATLSLESGT